MAKTFDPSRQMEVLFEMRRAGKNGVRVAAMDPVTHTEVTMIGDIRYGEELLKRMAARKLLYVLNKKRAEKSKT
jgi:hypothetical protein